MSYKLEYLPAAQQDLVEIVRYISGNLKNPDAAHQLAEKMIEAVETLRESPYTQPAYVPLRPLKHEYRRLLVQTYLVVYWVDEQEKQITAARVIYTRRDYQKLV